MSVNGFNVNGVIEKYNYSALDNIAVATNHINDDAVTEEKVSPFVRAKLGAIPTAPESDGVYRLVCTVVSGTPTYSWVAN